MNKWNKEYSLIKLAQEGDEDAITELYDKYYKVIMKTVHFYRGRGVSYAELEAASKQGFFVALDKHDPDKGYLGSYAKLWCREYCKREFILKRPVSRIPRDNYKNIPCEKVNFENIQEQHNSQKAPQSKFYFDDKELMYEMIDQLRPDYKLVLEMRLGLNGQTQSIFREIAEEFKTSTQNIRNKYEKAIKILRKMMNEYE